MATFAGTTQKCKACEKTVYLVDQLTADNKVYHKACFRCHHCKGTLKLSNYCSFEGVLYCKPHFNQLFKMTGSLDKSFEGAPKTVRVDRSAYQVLNGAKFSNPFVLDISDPVWGSYQQQSFELICWNSRLMCCLQENSLPIRKEVAVDGVSYHRPCFKCAHGGCVISPSNYVAHEHRLYCKHHHSQLFKEKGNFSQLSKNEQAKGVTENTASA
ncbi:unnamed protein product [Camellia sinensis]